jgi:hypothetical protein
MRDISGEMTPLMHPGDLVLSGQPDQLPLAWYYLPADLRYVQYVGHPQDASYMDWVYALKHLRASQPSAVLDPLVASLKPGQQLLFVRPLTEGAQNWKSNWTALVRRRSAQFGQILQNDVNRGILRQVDWAPHNYRGASILADSAVLYQKAT